jgi:putative molybdopterin biosynthesis protein
MMTSTLLTAGDVAGQLRIAKFTVYELIKRGELPSVKVGKQVRVSQADMDAYLTRRRTGPHADTGSGAPDAGKGGAPETPPRPEKAMILSGQDRCVDLLLAAAAETGEAAYRSFIGCYNGLTALYLGTITMAAAHLWDSETGEYNYPFIRALLPGVPAGVIRLAGRMQGFYVRKGNPLGIRGWEDLARPGVSMINRERGCGTRILLDQKLRLLGINPLALRGYRRESASHLGCAGIVAGNGADIGCGCESAAEQSAGVDFVPLQLEWYDLVFRLADRDSPAVSAVLSRIRSPDFKRNLEMMGGYDLSQTGAYREL